MGRNVLALFYGICLCGPSLCMQRDSEAQCDELEGTLGLSQLDGHLQTWTKPYQATKWTIKEQQRHSHLFNGPVEQ